MDTIIIDTIEVSKFQPIKIWDMNLTRLTEDRIEEMSQLIDLHDLKQISDEDFIKEIKVIHLAICNTIQIPDF